VRSRLAWPHFGHTFGHRIQIGIEQIGVHVERHRGAGMPEHPLNNLRLAPALIANDAAVWRRS